MDWRDEGIYPGRSATRDPTLNEPLVYEYVAYIPETDGSTKYYQSAVPLFRGSEYLIMLTEDVVIARQFQTQFLLLKRNFQCQLLNL